MEINEIIAGLRKLGEQGIGSAGVMPTARNTASIITAAGFATSISGTNGDPRCCRGRR